MAWHMGKAMAHAHIYMQWEHIPRMAWHLENAMCLSDTQHSSDDVMQRQHGQGAVYIMNFVDEDG